MALACCTPDEKIVSASTDLWLFFIVWVSLSSSIGAWRGVEVVVARSVLCGRTAWMGVRWIPFQVTKRQVWAGHREGFVLVGMKSVEKFGACTYVCVGRV